MRPVFIPAYIKSYTESHQDTQKFTAIRNAYQQISADVPQVSIVVPAYNEENNIVQCVSSLCYNITLYKVEIIVVDNNSKDKTGDLARACGVKCIVETEQGIVAARNAGLTAAKGKYILNADADTIYPKYWIEMMVRPLEKNNVALTYSKFSFIPVGSTGRLTYFFYEHLSDLSRTFNKYFKDEAVNVYGFSSGFKREQGLMVNGFHFPPGAGEDGYLALKLRDNGYGKLHKVTDSKALVWTTDRRIQIDGGLVKGLIKRIRRIFNL